MGRQAVARQGKRSEYFIIAWNSLEALVAVVRKRYGLQRHHASFLSGNPYLPETGNEHVAAQPDDESPNVATTAIPLESGESTYDQAERDQVIV
jgi:hypothetical protein